MNNAELHRHHQLITWLKESTFHTDLLAAVATLSLPDCYIAAGFVRNLVWDKGHGYTALTPLNDIDVVYFDDSENDKNAYLTYEARLTALRPGILWQVRNQAVMHHRNGDRPYKNTLDAMAFWPECETAIAARLLPSEQYEVVAAFELASLFRLFITPNPARNPQICAERIQAKHWLSQWPKLRVRSCGRV